MGEISEALKRARRGAAGDSQRPQKPTPTPYRDALQQEEELREERSATPRSDAPPAMLPSDAEPGHLGRIVWTDPRGPVSEHYRHFAIRLGRTLKGLDAHTVLVTSAARAEGKTTTSCNLALALASVAGGRQVALCELDLRRPAVSEELRVRPEVGIEELLAGSARLEDVRLRTNVPDLDLYLASQPAAAPLELLSAPALGAALRELGRRYDIVVIDSPPVLPVPDVPLILRHADAAVPVARMGITRRAAFQEMLTTLGNEKIVGCFLNQSGTPRHRRYYGYYAEDAEPAKRAAGEEPAT